MPPARRAAARPGVLLVVLLLALLGLSACAADQAADDSAGGSAAEAPAQDEAVPAPGAGDADGGADAPEEAGAGDEGAGTVLPGAAGSATGNGRRVVTSSVDVAVEDVPATAARVRAVAVRVGGEVADESSEGGDRPRAEIVLRVPAGDSAAVVDEVAALGEEVARAAQSEPVETRLVDLESRTATQRAGVERIRSLLEQATTLEDVLALEAELTRRQADLESVDAQRAALADLAALATVTVRLTTPDDVAAQPRELPPFLEGLDAGWDALGASTTVVLVILGGLLPFAVVGALVVGAVVLVLRALRRRRPAPAAHPAGPAGPAYPGPGRPGQPQRPEPAGHPAAPQTAPQAGGPVPPAV